VGRADEPWLPNPGRHARRGVRLRLRSGPGFRFPQRPRGGGLHAGELAAETAAADIHGGEAQRLVQDLDIPGQWWTLFHSPALTALIEEALKANPSLEAATAALREAQENVYAEQGALFPTVSGSLSTEREKISGATFGFPGTSSIFSVHTAQLSVSYPWTSSAAPGGRSRR